MKLAFLVFVWTCIVWCAVMMASYVLAGRYGWAAAWAFLGAANTQTWIVLYRRAL